jgi:hypothetical protein
MIERLAQTLWVALEWIQRHCIVPDGFRKGDRLRLYGFQVEYLRNFYLVRGDVEFDSANPVLGPAFVYRRGLLIGPQKVGKNPMIAAQVCLEGVGPALFAGWAKGDETYRCREWGCPCGWVYRYSPGEPMGMPWPTALIQITAFSQESTDNTYDALRPMVDAGPLHELIPHTGEEFIRLPNGGRIDTVTSSAPSRLGQRVTHAPQDEVGLWWPSNGMLKLADTQYRGLAGMGGRASLTSNAWDPSQHSVAQREFESEATDVYRQFLQPPANLSYTDRRDRRRIHRLVYPEDTWRENGGHVDLDAIEAEAADLVAKDPAQAARFFGNKLVAGSGKAFDATRWESLAERGYLPSVGAPIVLGFDGSGLRVTLETPIPDCTALIATEIRTGFVWPIGIWQPLENDAIDPSEVDDAVALAFTTWQVWRLYADPPIWDGRISEWAGRAKRESAWGATGEDRVIGWYTNRPKPMAYAVGAFQSAIERGEIHHSGDARLATHVGNAVRKYIGIRDDEGRQLWSVQKERSGSPLKIDAAVAAILSWQARNDALSAGVGQVEPEEPSIYETRGILSIDGAA